MKARILIGYNAGTSINLTLSTESNCQSLSTTSNCDYILYLVIFIYNDTQWYIIIICYIYIYKPWMPNAWSTTRISSDSVPQVPQVARTLGCSLAWNSDVWSTAKWRWTNYISLQSGWWFGTCFMFHNIWDNPSHWLIFFRGVETTNQQYVCFVSTTCIK